MLRAFLLLCAAALAVADLPVDCQYNDVVGVWNFYETERTGDANIDCSGQLGRIEYEKEISLEFPNKAVDEIGQEGTWTMVYDQGFEVRIGGRSYYAFNFYTKDGGNVTSYCGKTFNGWSRDFTVRNWACYKGEKKDQPAPKTRVLPQANFMAAAPFYQNDGLIWAINQAQSNWEATRYPQFESLSLRDVYRMNGAQKLTRPKLTKVRRQSSMDTKLRASMLPRNFDWRNVDGVNYVRPVKNQGACGSCYAFASIGVLESQLMIHSNDSVNYDLSAMDVVACSHLSQGCDGGFPYLIAGRYAQDNGIVSSDCMPYKINSACNRERSKCSKVYSMDYKYVGGYYGGTTEEDMMLALVNNGPVAVGIEVGSDFMQYKKGIYHKIKNTAMLKAKFDPFEETNHAVLLVGYGISDQGEKYWIVQNSWGTEWGMDGYVLIRRGTDEIGIESLALLVTAYP